MVRGVDRPDPDGELLRAALAGWVADSRAEQAAAARSRERWLRQQAEEAATWLGTLVDLAERGAPVRLELTSGTFASGTLVGIGRDMCLVAADNRRPATLVALAHVLAAKATPSAPPVAAGDRRPVLGLDLAGALGTLAAERETVRLGLTNRGEVVGQLLGAGSDVLTLRPGTPHRDHPASRGRTFLRLGAVVTCTPLR